MIQPLLAQPRPGPQPVQLHQPREQLLVQAGLGPAEHSLDSAINQPCLLPPYISHHLPVYSNRTDIRNRNLQNILVLRGSIYRYGSIVKYLWSGKKQKYEFHLSHIFRKRIRELISLMFCDGDLKRAQMRDARCPDYLDPGVVMVLVADSAAVLAHVSTILQPNTALLGLAIIQLKVDILWKIFITCVYDSFHTFAAVFSLASSSFSELPFSVKYKMYFDFVRT